MCVTCASFQILPYRLQSLGGGDGGDALSRTSPGQAGGVGSSTLNASQGAGASSGAELNRLAHDLLDIDPKRPGGMVGVKNKREGGMGVSDQLFVFLLTHSL